MSSWRERFEALAAELEAEGIHVEALEDGFWLPRLLHKRGRIAGLGLAGTAYVARGVWGTRGGYVALRHEAAHVRDQRRFTLPLFLATYFAVLPVGVTLRAFWEWRGYREHVRIDLEEMGWVRPETVDDIVAAFSSRGYLWMLPIPRFVRWLCRREEALHWRGPGRDRPLAARRRPPG